MIYRAVIKSSPGPSVFRGKTTNYLFKFFTDTSFNSDKHYQLPALLAWRWANPDDPRGRDPVPGQHPGWGRPCLRGILLHRQVANIYFSHNKLKSKIVSQKSTYFEGNHDILWILLETVRQKLGMILENIAFQKLKLSKNNFNKNVLLNYYFFIEKIRWFWK